MAGLRFAESYEDPNFLNYDLSTRGSVVVNGKRRPVLSLEVRFSEVCPLRPKTRQGLSLPRRLPIFFTFIPVLILIANNSYFESDGGDVYVGNNTVFYLSGKSHLISYLNPIVFGVCSA